MPFRRLRLAERRQAVGLTQEVLAERLGVDRTTIVRWEAGRGSPQPWMRPRLASALAIKAEALHDLLFESDAAREANPPQDAHRSSRSAELLQDFVPADLHRALADDAAASADFARFAAERNADDAVVVQLECDTAALAHRYVTQSPTSLHPDIRRLRDSVFRLLQGRQRPKQTADLYVSAGRLCGISAHICLDFGDYSSAATHARTAWACAEASGHNGLRAWVRAVQSLIAYWTGRHSTAVELAQNGRQYLAPGSIAARLASLEARALAKTGDRSGAAAALVTAEHARQEMQGDDDMPGLFSFPAAKQFAYAGTTHLAIGGNAHVQRAIASAESAITLYRGGDSNDRSVGDLFAAHLDLARAHLIAGDTDATETMLAFVLDASPAKHSASIVSRLTDLEAHLEAPQYRGSPQVDRLRERLVSTTAPAARTADLPEPPAWQTSPPRTTPPSRTATF